MVVTPYGCPRGQPCTGGLIADPYIHINGSNSVRLSAGSALYCELIADPYIHINGSNSI